MHFVLMLLSHAVVESILSLITPQQEFIIIIQILHHPASPLILQLQLRLLMLLLYTSENVESVSKVLTCLITSVCSKTFSFQILVEEAENTTIFRD